MSYQGDYVLAATVVFDFSTKSFGTPTTLSGSPAISVYKNSLTESTAGVTLTVDYDGRTGLNHVVIDTSADGTFYATATDFSVVVTTGTVAGVSAVGSVVGSFSIQNRSALRPTTASRTLDVSATGEAGVDWANVGSPTTANALTGTTISSSQVVASVTGAVGSVTGLTASNLDTTVSSRMATYTQPSGFLAATFPAGTVASTTNITGGTITTVTNLTNAATSGDLTATMKTSVKTQVTDALNVDTYAEPGQGAPPATTTIVGRLQYLYKNWRNKKTQTATEFDLFADDATTVDQKSTVSDDGTTATRGEVASGP